MIRPAALPFLLVLPATACLGAPITWGPTFNITGVQDISTEGTPVEAVNTTSGGDSPTVNVRGENITFQAFDPGVSGTGTGTYYTGGGGDTGDANLNTVLNSHVWSNGAWSLTLDGLDPGTDYQIQLIAGGDTRNCCSARNQRAGDGESPENLSADYSRSGVGSVIGTFTADATTQTIRILPGIVNGTDPSMSGYILRETAPPTPEPPTDIALSNTDLPPNMTAGSTVGVLSTTDPNRGDTHTYSLVGTLSHPDNSLFTIVSGNVLRAAAALGGFGSSYRIKLRTTDDGGLFHEEVFLLEVEAARPPTALSFSANTVLRATPAGGTVGTFSTIDGNSADSHSYTLVPGPGADDNGLFQIDGDVLEVAADLPALGSALSIRVRTTDLSGAFIEETFGLTVVDSSLRLNEFLADNTGTTLADEDGDTPDWIELHNPDGGSVNLGGLYLTDDPANLTKWTLPAVALPGNGFLVVFASSKDRRPADGQNLHTNFSLNSGGEYLALVAADGTTLLSQFGAGADGLPRQKAGISFGFFGDPLQIGFLLEPTPGAANNSGVLGFVEDTKFDFDRGFYDAPFDLTISTATPGATIRYTTNGDWPSETSGTIYNGPITVDRSMPVKAIAYKAGFEPTNVDTHTYILVESILGQTDANTQNLYGLPDFGNKYYGMNNNPAVNPQTHPTIADDLKAVPSLSIAIDADDLFGGSGIYTNPQSSGTAWERKTSLELIDPADPSGAGNFQVNCAIRIQGGAFRSFGLTRKKSFRVLFKSQFGTGNQPTGGPGALRFPIFGTAPGVAQEFQTLTFRMEANDGWQWGGANGQPQYSRDEFGRRAQLALGQPASHGRFLHLHINGVYWGVYNVVERPDSGFAESYIEGAVREAWEGQNSGNPINDATNLSTWNSYKSAVAPISSAGNDAQRDAVYLRACGFNPDGSRNPAFPIWCDPDNTADYFLVNWYGGNSDWPQKNYYGGIDTQPARTGYKYFMWDAEWSLFLRSNTGTNRITDYRGIAEPNDDLEESPEYQIRFADRAHRALFNNGPLTPQRARALYDEIVAQHRSILVPEAARWGNQHNQQRDLGDWENEYNRIVNDWFPVRADILVGMLRAEDLYPDIDAPIYSPHGGSVPVGGGPTLIVPQTVGTVYTMFGPGDANATDYGHSLDPRLVGGGISPAATLIELGGGGGGPATTVFIDSGDTWKYLADGSDQATAWRGVLFNDAGWPSGASELGYGDGDEETDVGYVDLDPDPDVEAKNATTYFRKVVNIPDPMPFADFTIDLVYDDAYAIYVNGSEVARHSGLSANAPYDEYASNTVGNNASDSLTIPTGAFVAGNNTIAAEMHQTSPTSSDISFDIVLTGNPPGGGNTHASDPLVLTEPGWLFSRSYNPSTGEWSALNTAFFSIDSIPADASNLVVSEFHYHPAEPVLPAEVEISTDRDDYEFIELMNIAPQPIDLSGVSFTEGITYVFPENTILPAGNRLVLARHAAAFAARYGRQPDGVYSGRLSNDGETLILESSITGGIRDFTYNDQLPWPVIADGDGPSLVLIAPAQPAPDHGAAANWAASGSIHGSPGATASIGFSGDPNADADGDRLSAFLEFVLAGSDSDPSDAAAPLQVGTAPFTVGMATDDYLTFTVRKNLLAHNIVDLQAEVSSDLSTWTGGDAVVFLSETESGDGTATLLWRSATPIHAASRQYIRLRAVQR